jgi:hypothetical protein
MNDDFDITEFAKMFDAALASDNPSVKKALRNFMMVAAIVHAQELNEDERLMGPFEALLKKVQSLEAMVRELQNNRTYKDNYKDYYNNHTRVTQPYTTNTTSVTSGDAKTWKSMYNGQTVKSHEIYELLKDLKTK